MKGKKNGLMIIAVIVMSIGIVFFIVGTEPKTEQQLREGGDDGSAILHPNDPEHFRELDISVFTTPAQFNTLKQFEEPLEGKFPKLSVNLMNDRVFSEYSESFLKELIRTISIGDASDILLVDNRLIPALASEGVILPLDEWTKPEEAYVPHIIDTIRWNDTVWGVPWEADPYVLIWHPEGLQTLGFSSLPQTEEALIEMQGQLEQQNIPMFFLDALDPYAAISLLNVWDDGFSGARAGSVNYSDAKVWTSLKEGEFAFVVTRASMLTSQLVQDDFKLASLKQLNPQADSKDRFGWVGGKSFVVTAVTEREQEAREWLQHAASAEAFRSMLNSGMLPPFTELIHSDAFNVHPFAEQLRQSYSDTEMSFAAPSVTEMDKLTELLNEFWSNKITAEALQSSYRDWLEQASRYKS